MAKMHILAAREAQDALANLEPDRDVNGRGSR